MKYISTRNKNEKKSFFEALIAGISAEGGLFVPESFPAFTNEHMDKLCEGDYFSRAAMIISAFAEEFPHAEATAKKAYEGKFEEDDPAPLLKVDGGTFFLELFHGPTLAFKDLALSLLPRLLSEAKRERGDKTRTLILTATSGDTGTAALNAFKDAENLDIMVFYPAGGVSRAQELQMTTQEGKNIAVIAVEGNFDDCQRAVKDALSDAAFKADLGKLGISAGSANSVSIGRLIPQIAYYFSAYADMLAAEEIKRGDKVNFAVPAGNFGNILAGFYAKKMGLPINKLICASNENHILTDFFASGVYDTRREFIKTTSPSMDILVSSNLERLIFEVTGRDDRRTAELYNELRASGMFKITEAERQELGKDFFAWYADEKTVSETIEKYFDDYDYLLDPHTAVAAAAYGKYRRLTFDDTPTVIVATAHPYKFAPAVYEAVMNVEEKDPFRAMKELSDISAIDIPGGLQLQSRKVLHNKVIKKEQIKNIITEFIKR